MLNNKMKRKISSISHSFFIALLVFAILMFSFIMIYVVDSINVIQSEIKTIESQINDNLIVLSTNEEKAYIESYRELTDKADSSITRLISTVGILATVYTIFGALIVFKAPHDIDIRISKLNELIADVDEAAKETSYQEQIIDSLVNNYNGQSDYNKLRSLSKVIKEFPEKPDAYLQKGFIYDDMGKYDEAILEYEKAYRNGASKSAYYNNTGIAFAKKGEKKKAITFFTKAISDDPDDPFSYINRSRCHLELTDLDLAIIDCEKVFSMDNNIKEAYILRADINRERLMLGTLSEEEETKLKECIVDDLEFSLKLDPSDKYAKKRLESFMAKTQVNPQEMIAKVRENIGDLEYQGNHHFAAFEQYVEAVLYYLNSGDTVLKRNIKVIFCLIDKIFNLKKEIVSLGIKISEEKKIEFFGECLVEVATFFYKQKSFEYAEKGFILAINYSESQDACLNLAFMVRRNETNLTTLSSKELLSKYNNQNSAIWCVNMALVYVEDNDLEKGFYMAIKVMNNATEYISDAITWWCNKEVVGEQENNIVMILFYLSFPFEVDDDVSIEDRFSKAKQDGYNVPEGEELDSLIKEDTSPIETDSQDSYNT